VISAQAEAQQLKNWNPACAGLTPLIDSHSNRHLTSVFDAPRPQPVASGHNWFTHSRIAKAFTDAVRSSRVA
jgi:hypothetical protein